MSAIFADCGQGITSLPAKIMSCVPIQVSCDFVFRFHQPALAKRGCCGAVWGGGLVVDYLVVGTKFGEVCSLFI